MKRGTDDNGPGSWLRKARVEGQTQGAVPEERPSPGSAPAEDAGQGWDPFEVWLRRVHLPRKRERSDD